MKTKIVVSYPNDIEQSEIIQAEPFESLKFICKINKTNFEISKLVNVGNGYEYPVRNNIIIQAKKIA